MYYPFERSLGRLAESATPPMMFLAERNGVSLQEAFLTLCEEFESAYDKGEIVVQNQEIRFSSKWGNIILAPNQNADSPYPYYLRFKLFEPTTEALTQDRAREIHSFLLSHFESNTWHPMVSVSQVLARHGYTKERFGFSKMKGLFLALAQFLTLRDTITNGTPDVEVQISPLEATDAADVQAAHPYSFSSNLSELIEATSPAAAAYARDCGKTVDAAFEELSEAFEHAYSQGNIREDGTALHFMVGSTSISLVPNQVTTSPYPYYLRFSSEEELNTVPEHEAMTLQDEQEIYQLLIRKFPLGEWLPMASVSLELSRNGFGRERFGFSKMKDMLETLQRFISLQNTVTNGVPAILVKLHRVSEWDQMLPIQTSAAKKSGVRLPQSLKDIRLSSKTLSKIYLQMTGTEAVPPQSVVDSICAAYDAAQKPDKVFAVDETFRFLTDLKNVRGETIDVTIKASDMENVDWYLNWGGVSSGMFSGKPGEAFEQFAFLGPWQDFLEKLAAKALPENWGFKDASENDYTILRQYIKFTFYHLQLEDKICVSEDGALAAFNTGLVNRHYEDIYACFAPNLMQGRQKWFFQGFCIAGERGLGKQLVDAFDPLPQAASYFTVKEDLLFDVDRDIYADYRHMLLDNMDRLPIAFLEEELRNDSTAMGIIEELKTASVSNRAELYNELRDTVESSSRLYNRLKNRMEDAIELAVKRVRWNFKTALPCFYPQGNAMSLMLPVGLVEDDRADVALVVERTKSGSYQGQTILTLQAAYIDARLICRPDSDWLRTSEICAADEEDD